MDCLSLDGLTDGTGSWFGGFAQVPECRRQLIAGWANECRARAAPGETCGRKKKNRQMVVQNFTSTGMIARPDACRYT